MADGVQEMSFTEAGIAVDEERIISVAEGLTYGDTTCMGETIARPDDEIFEGVVRMKAQSGVAVHRRCGTL